MNINTNHSYPSVHFPKPVSTDLTIKSDSVLSKPIGERWCARLIDVVKHLPHKVFLFYMDDCVCICMIVYVCIYVSLYMYVFFCICMVYTFIKIENSVVCYKEFSDNQIDYVCDFFDGNDNLESWVNIVHGYEIKKKFFK